VQPCQIDVHPNTGATFCQCHQISTNPAAQIHHEKMAKSCGAMPGNGQTTGHLKAVTVAKQLRREITEF
jgi:hypothetical protein